MKENRKDNNSSISNSRILELCSRHLKQTNIFQGSLRQEIYLTNEIIMSI